MRNMVVLDEYEQSFEFGLTAPILQPPATIQEQLASILQTPASIYQPAASVLKAIVPSTTISASGIISAIPIETTIETTTAVPPASKPASPIIQKLKDAIWAQLVDIEPKEAVEFLFLLLIAWIASIVIKHVKVCELLNEKNQVKTRINARYFEVNLLKNFV